MISSRRGVLNNLHINTGVDYTISLPERYYRHYSLISSTIDVEKLRKVGILNEDIASVLLGRKIARKSIYLAANDVSQKSNR